jgi:hypothetical protein
MKMYVMMLSASLNEPAHEVEEEHHGVHHVAHKERHRLGLEGH